LSTSLYTSLYREHAPRIRVEYAIFTPNNISTVLQSLRCRRAQSVASDPEYRRAAIAPYPIQHFVLVSSAYVIHHLPALRAARQIAKARTRCQKTTTRQRSTARTYAATAPVETTLDRFVVLGFRSLGQVHCHLRLRVGDAPLHNLKISSVLFNQNRVSIRVDASHSERSAPRRKI
jgi:hypothetical protein